MKMLHLKILLLILIQVVFQLCYSKNIIEPLNGLKLAHLNKNYSLVCHFGPGKSLEWLDSEDDFIDIRFNCKHSGASGFKTTKLFLNDITTCDRTTKTSILYIKNITRAHNGTIVKCHTDQKTEEFQINVSESTDPLPFLITTLSRDEIYDGQNVEVKCRWSENVPVKLKLKCLRKEKTGNGSASLNLTLTKEWNNKLCVCEAFYYGTRTVAHHELTVFSSPQVSVNNVTVVAGTLAVLNCSASEGYPANYSYLGWQHLFNNIVVEERQTNAKNGSLIIPNATWQDAGTWICFVSNGRYNQSNYGYLNITGPPILQALNPNVEAKSGASKKLEVQIYPFYDDIDITWKHNDQKISKRTPGKISSAWQQKIKGKEVYLSGLTASLALHNIQQKDAGNYSVTVFTKDGSNHYIFQMQIIEKTDVTLITAGLICGTLAMIFLISILACIYFCTRRQKYHSTKIDPSMSTPRTRIFSVPRNDSFERKWPTSNLELDIYEEIDDWHDNDFNKKREEGYLNPTVIRYT